MPIHLSIKCRWKSPMSTSPLTSLLYVNLTGLPRVYPHVICEQTDGKAIWNVNNVSYVAPKVPTLAKVLAGANSASDFNVTENTFILPAHKTIQIIFPPTYVRYFSVTTYTNTGVQ